VIFNQIGNPNRGLM